MNMNKNKTFRVLIADDESAIVRIYSIGLQHYFSPDETSAITDLESELFGESDDNRPGADIAVCQQGAEAVRLAKEAHENGNPFHVIVLDIRMPPGISGVEAAQQIRQFDQTVPILFVSGFSDYSLADLQQSVPPPELMSFMEKPVQLAALARQIKHIAGQHSDLMP